MQATFVPLENSQTRKEWQNAVETPTGWLDQFERNA